MFIILKYYGIPERLLSKIKLLYTNTKAKVVTKEGSTEEFIINSGILQGDTLAPFLFIICVDFCMRRTVGYDESKLGFTLEQRKSSRYGPKIVTDFDYVDDICLTSNDKESAQVFLNRVENICSEVGLLINESKTEYMTFNDATKEHIKTANEANLAQVRDFKYLGSYIYSSRKDMAKRIALAWAASRKLSNIWKSNLCQDKKYKVFVACVESVLLYGSETWVLTKELEKKIDGTHARLLRIAFDIDWFSLKTNESVYGDKWKASKKIRSRRLKLAGHSVRHPETMANMDLFWMPTHGTRKRGRPNKTYIGQLKQDTGIENVN